MSAAVQNAAIQTTQATDDDYFAFSDSADTEASQAASDIGLTNKCNLEVLQFLDDRNNNNNNNTEDNLYGVVIMT